MDIFSKAALRDPYPLYQWRLHNSPVYYDRSQRSWIVFKFKDAVDILKSLRYFSSSRPLSSSPEGLGYNFALFCQDPPDHTRLRSYIKHGFTSAKIAALSHWMENCVETLLDQQASVQFDFAERIALPFPIMVITKMLGVDGDRWPDLKLWTEMIVGHHNRDNQYPGRKAFMALHALFSKEILDRRSHRRDDIISELAGC
jgi:cytochrome P450